MGRIVLIDGYNVIGSQGRFRKDREVLARERESLVRTLSEYKSQLAPETEIQLVFDGFPSEREPFRHSGLGFSVIFSEEEGSADAVLIRLSERYGSRAIVVTSDREVILRVQSAGARVVGAREFMARVETRRSTPVPKAVSFSEKPVEGDDNDASPSTRKKGNPRRLSKKERARRKTLLNL